MPYFAAALARTPEGWAGQEFDLDEYEDLEALAEALRDLSGEGPGPTLLVCEEDDEYVAFVRVDGGAGSLAEPRVFLSDHRAVMASDVAAMLWEGAPDPVEEVEEEDDEESRSVLAETIGEAGLLADLGTGADALLKLCAEEGLLPADVIAAVSEPAGFSEALERLRES